MAYESVDRANVELLVRTFYDRILRDEMLSPFFIRALGSDLNGGKWYEHLRTLDSFWLLMMNGEFGYKGDPFPAHAFLGPLTRAHFEQWLKLFKQTVEELYTPEISAKFYKKADILAEQFIDNMDIDNDDDDDW